MGPRKRHGRRDSARAFVGDPESTGSRVKDDLAEMIAEAYVMSATSGEEQGEEALNEFVVEEVGGPFVDEFDEDDQVEEDSED